MYKKITHNIVEEHFDHPVGANIKNTAFKPRSQHLIRRMHMVSALAWAQLSWRIRSLVISVITGYADIDELTARADNDIKNIADCLREQYGNEVANAFSSGLLDVAMKLVDVFYAIKNDEPIDMYVNRLSSKVNEFAQLVESVNPEKWPATVVEDYLVRMANFYIEQAVNRKQQKWMDGIMAADSAYNLIVSGLNGEPPFSYYFAEGIRDPEYV